MSSGHGHTHAHSHGLGAADHRGRLALVLAITVLVLVAEVAGAVVTGSLALLADAGHMLTDVAGLTMSLVAAALARRPPDSHRTWGFLRAEALAASAQSLLLLVVGCYVIVEGVRRLGSPPEIGSDLMLVFGIVGLVGNVVGLAILASARGDDLNMRAAFLEVLNDALGSVAVIVAALLTTLVGWHVADAVAALLIGVLIIPRALRLLHASVRVLMEAVPPGLDLEEVRRRVLSLSHVRAVHDLHASQIRTGLPIVSLHVVVDDSCFHDGHLTDLLDDVQQTLAADFDVEHSTIQFEPERHASHEPGAHD